ncbi:Sodium-coupled monocarboxylate transporter 1 [Bulinus truncatus]|nr:Sodium-coupled monocarboxylate transporter 1 [Bulinus truncatus]
MGNRNMSVLPVAVSIVVSFISAIVILGTPAEVYIKGTEYIISCIGICIGITGAALLFVPLLYPLKLTSVYEIVYMGISSFAPAIAFQVVTGIPVWVTFLTTGAIATIYTTIGSLKVGGLSKVLDINDKWQRIRFFNFDPDPRVRHTFWNMIIGQKFLWLAACAVNQPGTQRYCSLSSLRKAQLSVLLSMIGVTLLVMLTCLSGVVLFAYYASQNCNPLGQKLVSSSNQLVPYFVMETLGFPGVPGLFIACLFSGSLSSISSSLNALGAITWEDFLKPRFDHRLSESQNTLVIKVSVFIYGVLAVGFSLIVERMEGTVLQVSIGLSGAASGPMVGMFILGAFFPWANSHGAFCGALVGLGLSFWMGFGAYIQGIRLPPKPFPNGTCSTTANYSNSLMSTLAGSLTASNLTMTSAPYTLEGSTTLANFTLDLNTSGHVVAVSLFQVMSFPVSLFQVMSFPVSLFQVMSFRCLCLRSCHSRVSVSGHVIPRVSVSGLNKMSDVPIKYQIPVAYRLCCCLPQSWQRWLNCNREYKKVEICTAEQPTNGDVATTSINQRSTELKPLLAPQVWLETGRLNVTENSSIDQTDSETQ